MPSLDAREQKSTAENAVWVEGSIESPASQLEGPLVMGEAWMLEVVRFKDPRRTLGLFLASYGIVELQALNTGRELKGRFVGLSGSEDPPAAWLTTSVICPMGNTSLPRSADELLGLFQEPCPYTPIDPTPHASSLSKKAKLMIEEGYRDMIRISTIADGLGVSHSHLSRQFKHDLGLTPHSYRKHLRVNDAVARLSRGEKTLDVAHEVGFNDASRFYDGFRKVTGTSPGRCR